MADAFDPYYEWLGIPRKDQPPHHYRLLGIEVFEENLNVIERAADRQMSHVRTFQVGRHGKQSQGLLNELSAAKICLLNPEKKRQYDQRLSAELGPSGSPADELSDGVLPPVAVASTDLAALEQPAAEPAFDFRPHELAAQSASARVRRRQQPSIWQQPWLKWGGAAALAIVLTVALVALLTSRPRDLAARNPQVEEDSQRQPDEQISRPEPAAPEPPRTQFREIDESLHVPTDVALAGPWPAAAPELEQRMEQALGMLEEQFAICQTMPLNQFIDTARDLRPCGYRLIRARPFQHSGGTQVAAIWSRDGLPWRMAVVRDAEAIRKADERLRLEQFRGVDVAGFRSDGDRFLALWTKQSAEPETSMTIGVAQRDLQARSNSLRSQGFVPVTRQVFLASGGDVQTSSIWSRLGPDRRGGQSAGSADDWIRALQPGQFPLDLSLHPSLTGSEQCLSTYLSDTKRPFKHTIGLPLHEHRKRCQEFAALGYRPAAIGVAKLGGGSSLVAVSLWHLPAGTGAEVVTAPPAESSPQPRQAQSSHALRFAGRDRVVLQATEGLTDTSRDFTAEAWIRLSPRSPASSHYLMGNGVMGEFHAQVPAQGLGGWFLILQALPGDLDAAGMMILRLGSPTGSDGPNGPTSPLGPAWHHVAICNKALPDRSFRFSLFCDGQRVLQQTRPGEQALASPLGFCLGPSEQTSAGLQFHGDMRAFRLSSRVRYQETFRPPETFTVDAEVLALLDFSGAAADRVLDLSGHQRHGQIVGAHWVDLATEPEPQVMLAAGDRKPPLPATTELRSAVRRARDSFEAELAAAKERLQIAALAEQLLEQTGEKNDPTRQLERLLLARELAIEALEFQLTLRAIEALADHFEFDVWAHKAAAINSLRAAARGAPDLSTITVQALAAFVHAKQAEAYAAANEILESIKNAARRLNDNDLKSLTNRLSNQLGYDLRAWRRAEAAREIIATRPADAEANRALGKYLCFSRDQWELGLRHLEMGDDGLAALARRDRQSPAQDQPRLELARDWQTWADAKNRGLDQNGGWTRARYWYEQVLPGLAGPDQVQVEEALNALSGKVVSRDVLGTRLAYLDVPAGEVRRLRGHTENATCLAVSKTGKLLVSGSLDDTVRVWDLVRGESIATLPAAVGDVVAVLLTSNDEFVIVVGRRGDVETWNTRAGIKSGSTKLGNPVQQMTVASGSPTILWSRRGTVTDNLVLKTIGRPATGPMFTCPTEPTAIALSRLGGLAAASDANHAVYAWQLATEKRLGPFTGSLERVTDVAISPNERLVAAATANEVTVWDADTGQELKRLRDRDETFSRLIFSRDCRRLISSGLSNQLSVWDLESGSRIQRLTSRGRNNSRVSALAFLPDNRGAVTAGNDGLIRIWRLPDD